MHVTELTVSNFRLFEERRINFHPEFNLIIGENASGKTSVLEALAVALGSWLLGFRGTDSRHIRTSDVRTIVQDSYDQVRDLPQYPVRVTARGVIPRPGQLGDITVNWSRALNGPRGKTTQVDSADLKKVAREHAALVLAGKPTTLPVLRYFGAGRLWESVRDTPRKIVPAADFPSESAEEQTTGQTDFRSPFEGYRLSVDKRCSPVDLIRWMGQQRFAEIDEGRESASLQTVYRAILSLLPEISDVRYQIRTRSVVLTYRDGRRSDFHSLSDGYRNIVAVAADLAIKMVMLNPHLRAAALETPGVVLIDELDLHLHPKWQRRVISDLRRTFPAVQFICTTHSPFIVQSLRSGEELVVLDGQPTAQVANMTLDEVATGLMGVEETDFSERYAKMKSTAKEFLDDLAKSGKPEGSVLKEFENRLASATAPYADNPAYQAFLELQLARKAGL